LRLLSPRIALAAAVALAVAFYIVYAISTTPGTVSLTSPPSSFTVNGRTFGITYIAASQSSRETGLMNTKITNSTTMLFLFPSFGKYSFWMSNVNSSLDIIWLNVSGRIGDVVYVVRDAPGCSSSVSCPVYQPTSPANWVIEAKGGFSAHNGVVVGTTIHFK